MLPKTITPEVGMGATLCMWSDQRPCTVLSVSGKTIVVQEDHATRTDKNGMSEDQTYTYAPNPDGETLTFTLRKNGRWVQKGSTLEHGISLSLGHREKYHEFSL